MVLMGASVYLTTVLMHRTGAPVNFTTRGNRMYTMADITASGVDGFVLPSPVVEDNAKHSLVRWLRCRGYKSKLN
jgi:hypothetical protein